MKIAQGTINYRLIRYRDNSLNRKYSIFVGNERIHLGIERGAEGIMTGFAFTLNVGEFHNLFSNSDKDKAEDLFDIYLPLIRHEQQFGIGLV